MLKSLLFILSGSFILFSPFITAGKELPKVAVWDLEPRNTPETQARELTSFVVSEITKLKRFEVYSQENVRTLAGWTAERMKLGCTDTQCLLALGQMDVAKLISGSVGKIGKRYTVSLNLFNTQNARAENAISKTCESEDELIELIQAAVRELFGEAQETSAATTITAAKVMPGVYRDSTTGMEFILVKSGCFEMGDTFGDGDFDEKPGHEVCLKDFYLGKYEVTQGQWKKVAGNNPSHFKEGDEYPVESVTWNDVQEFIRGLNQISGKSYRLPTEAEWEYAARSGGKREKWAGTSSESELGDYGWFSRNSDERTHPVGQKKPNGLGFYDMSGNVWEWLSDRYASDYYQNSPRYDPSGAGSGQLRVLRGGSRHYAPSGVRSAYRGGNEPSKRYDGIGFRLGFSLQ